MAASLAHRARRRIAALGAFAIGIALLLGASASRAERRVVVYEPRHRLAAELEAIAQVVLEGSGSVALDRGTNALVLIGEADAVAKAAAVLAEQDRALRQVVLRYDTRRRSTLAAQGFDVAWRAKVGAYRLGRLRARGAAGSSIRSSGSSAEARLVASLQGRLRVVEGGTTRIETGVAIPFATTGSFGTNTQIVDATTGFEARARILGDGRVRVDLAGFADRFEGDGTIATMRASTLVDLEPGEAVVVGAIDQIGARRRTTSGPGATVERTQDETLLLLRADVEE